MISARWMRQAPGKPLTSSLSHQRLPGRPLCRPPAVAERLARVDRHAVDHPGRERVELAAYRAGRRLVEQRKTLAHLPDMTTSSPGRPSPSPRGSDRRSASRALGHAPGVLGPARAAIITRPFRGRAQMAVLDALGLVLEQASRRARAIRRRPSPAPFFPWSLGDHHREERRSARLAGLHVGGIRALAEVDRFLEPAVHQAASARSSRSSAPRGSAAPACCRSS